MAELILIRHGATEAPGRLHGRSDPGLAAAPARATFDVAAIWVSPARRARETAAALWPGLELREEARLWEQDFGAWDGQLYADLPDIGTLGREALADHASEGGESFAGMVSRVSPALRAAAERALDVGGRIAIVAHAGTVRAGLALATGDVPGALAFEVGHLSATRIRCLPGGAFAVIGVNGALT